MNHWLVKEEPAKYSFERFLADGDTLWTGVRNYQARNHLRAMRTGDPVLYWHTGKEKAAVGVAEVVREAFPDPTAKEGDWSAVEIRARRPLRRSVPLGVVRDDRLLSQTALVKQTRLSVVPLTKPQFDRFVKLGDTASR